MNKQISTLLIYLLSFVFGALCLIMAVLIYCKGWFDKHLGIIGIGIFAALTIYSVITSNINFKDPSGKLIFCKKDLFNKKIPKLWAAIGPFLLPLLVLYSANAIKMIEMDKDAKGRVLAAIDSSKDSLSTQIDSSTTQIQTHTDTIVDEGVKEANMSTYELVKHIAKFDSNMIDASKNLSTLFSKQIEVSSGELTKLINKRDQEQQNQVANLGIKVTEAFGKLNLNITDDRKAAEERQQKLLSYIDTQMTNTGVGILDLIKRQSVVDSVRLELLKKLIERVDSLSNNQQMDSSLKEDLKEIQERYENLRSVIVCVNNEDVLEQQGYLQISGIPFFKNYKVLNFPDINSSAVREVDIGDTLRVKGELVALCDYQGKLRKGKEYAIIGQPDSSQTLVVFSRPLIAGQRILAVTKK